MSLINPTIYVCPVCGLIDFDNYDDDEFCMYCESKLINTKIPRNICGQHSEWWYRQSSNNFTRFLKRQYIFANESFSIAEHKNTFDQINGWVLYHDHEIDTSSNRKKKHYYCKGYYFVLKDGLYRKKYIYEYR